MTVSQVKPFSDKICYFLNSGSMGDCIAAAPIVKYAIEHFHTNADYIVAICKEFRSIFHFIPEEKIMYINAWDGNVDSYPRINSYIVKLLVQIIYKDSNGKAHKPENIAGNVVTKYGLINYAALGLLSRIVDIKDFPYIPLQPVDVDHFEIDFDKAIVINVVNPGGHRSWPIKEITKTSEAIRDMGLIPVFIGKTGKAVNEEIRNSDFVYPGFGIDLTNKTSIQELATIMAKSRAVMGIDSGPMHIAMTTNTPVIVGFTHLRPELYIPYRKNSITIPIIAEELACRFCHSDWNLYTVFDCPRNMANPECADMMTAEKFIAALKTLGIR